MRPIQFTGDLASPNNPLADADGNIHVTPGKHIPMIPVHQFKVGADYAVTPDWKVGGDVVVVGSQYFVGDEANQNPQLPAYAVFNLRTTYQVSKNVQVFGFINNLFNKKYGLYGTYLRAARRRQCRPADHPHRSAHRSPRPAVLDLRRRADEAIARQNPLCRSRRPAAGQDLAR